MRMTALWWWIDRWRKSTAFMDMTLAEQGAYRNLLDEAHLRGGPLPLDERILAKACGDALAWPEVRTAVLARFERREDGWHNLTLEEVMRESERRAELQAEKGRQRAASAARHSGRFTSVSPAAPAKEPAVNQPEGQPHTQPPVPVPVPVLISGSGSNVRAFAFPASPASVDDAIAQRAGTFVQETYPTLYRKYRKGARYVSKPNLDFLEALELCRVWDDDRLTKIATVFLTTDHDFAESGSRTLAQFRALASWCDSRLMEAGIA